MSKVSGPQRFQGSVASRSDAIHHLELAKKDGTVPVQLGYPATADDYVTGSAAGDLAVSVSSGKKVLMGVGTTPFMSVSSAGVKTDNVSELTTSNGVLVAGTVLMKTANVEARSDSGHGLVLELADGTPQARVAYASTANEYLTDAAAGDMCLVVNTGKKLLLGANTTAGALVTGSGIQTDAVAEKTSNNGVLIGASVLVKGGSLEARSDSGHGFVLQLANAAVQGRVAYASTADEYLTGSTAGDMCVLVNSGRRVLIGADTTPGAIVTTNSMLVDTLNELTTSNGTSVNSVRCKAGNITLEAATAQTVGVKAAASGAGYGLTIGGGDAQTGGTDLAGGDALLQAGASTGTGKARTSVRRADAAASTGTAYNGFFEGILLPSTGNYTGTNNTAFSMFEVTLATTQGFAAMVHYGVQVTGVRAGASNTQSVSGLWHISCVNQAGTMVGTVARIGTDALAASGAPATTCTVTLTAVTGTGLVTYRAAVNSNLNTGNPQVKFSLTLLCGTTGGTVNMLI